MPTLPLVALALLLAAAPVSADIYRCQTNGRAVYTETPSSPDCQPLNINMTPGNPQEAERIRQQHDDTENWLDRAQAEIAERDREIAREREAKMRALALASEPAHHTRLARRWGWSHRRR